MKKQKDLFSGDLVKTPEGIGIVVRKGLRETKSNIDQEIFERVVLVTVNQETKWFLVDDVELLN
jgi:hypothetical protein